MKPCMVGLPSQIRHARLRIVMLRKELNMLGHDILLSCWVFVREHHPLFIEQHRVQLLEH